MVDALRVINVLGREERAEGDRAFANDPNDVNDQDDVSGDGRTSELDALLARPGRQSRSG